MRYDSEAKAKALEMMATKGVSQTCADMNISKQTLYKWRNEAKKSAAIENTAETEEADAEVIEAAKRLLSEEALAQAETVQRLEHENACLREENAALRDRISKLKNAIAALIV